ncbi:hypothetical protein FGO68_gene16099 [Halteria grandinella]|uniref:Uncharacterized protein n=1 Tax=Halteria grandinella TaxID=5974 RepID=A0A8J8NF39_HALGN|nr:hypothetical protein FGO68_gene16099 [Halteria grandinella]
MNYKNFKRLFHQKEQSLSFIITFSPSLLALCRYLVLSIYNQHYYILPQARRVSKVKVHSRIQGERALF